VQMENNPSSRPMNAWGKRNGKFRPIVNPYDIARPHPFKQGTKDITYEPAMQEPGQALEISSPAFIELQPGQQADRFRRKFPGVIRCQTNHDIVGCAAENIGRPARDRAPMEFRKWFRFSKKMIITAEHVTSPKKSI